MPTWNPDQYLKFAEERTRPCRDLAARIEVEHVRTIIDLGCGPGNSTAVLSQRWPEADLKGLDNSSSMIDVARQEQPQYRWIVDDISHWASAETARFDVVFSNAALHWVPDHASLFPRLFARVANGGALAIQIPADFSALPHRIMRELAPPGAHVREWFSHEPAFYYDVLALHVDRLDIWEIEYQHILPNADAIVEWYKGTGIRPFLEAMATDTERERFMSEYAKRIRAAYPPRPDGKVVFPFRRLFIVAYSSK